jgi:YVTN family beta-propeller protein
MTRFALVLSGLLFAVCACQPFSDEPRIQLTPDSISHLSLSSPVSSSAVAVSPDGRLVAAVNPDSDSITLVDAITLVVLAEVPVGDDPRSLSFTPDSQKVVVTCHGSAIISVVDLNESVEVAQYPVGYMPYGVVTDGVHAFVAEYGLGNVSVIDLETGALVKRIPVEAFPAGLALSQSGEHLFVTHFFTGRITVIDQMSSTVQETLSTGSDTNLSQFIAIAPDGKKAYLPQTRSNTTNMARLFDTTVFPIVNVLDVANLRLLVPERITLDTADKPVNMPFSVALSPDGETLYLANTGSNDVSVIDLNTNHGVAHIAVGANPRGIAITPDGSRIFVNNVLDGTLSVIDTETFSTAEQIILTEIPLEPLLLRGKQIFNSAALPSLTTDNWISCATCHFDGTMDTRTWLGFPDGPRNTPSLQGVRETLPIHWSGDLDELQDVEITIRNIQFGTGLVPGTAHDSLGPPFAGLSDQLDALAAYIASIEVRVPPKIGDREAINLGDSLFASLGCSTCHVPPLYTDQQLHNVGTGNIAMEKNSHGRGTMFDTPSLRGIWQTAPYFHDGSATTLERLLSTGNVHDVSDKLDDEEVMELIAFLRSLPEGNR